MRYFIGMAFVIGMLSIENIAQAEGCDACPHNCCWDKFYYCCPDRELFFK